MNFKNGDRIHVKRLNGLTTDFYATLVKLENGVGQLKYSTGSLHENRAICLPDSNFFGPDKEDYFELVEDEEDSEEPVIQRINDMYNDVPTHYQADIDVIEFCRQHFTDEEFKGAMKFNLIKYPTRIGRKDNVVKELDKIIDYAQRYKEVLESGTTR